MNDLEFRSNMSRGTGLLVPLLALLVSAGTTSAGAPGINISWDGCTTGAASAQRCYDCGGSAGAPFVIAASFRTLNPIPEFAGSTTWIDLTFTDGDGSVAPVPDFWSIGASECAGANVRLYGPDASGGCLRPAGADTTQAGGGYAILMPDFPASSHVHILVDYNYGQAVPPAIAAGPLYGSCSLSLDFDGIVRAGCTGCSTHVLLSMHSIELFGWRGEDYFLTTADQQGSIQWQSTTASPCGSVPSRRASWGAIKALYR
jgi:hypothetical protein